MANNNMVSIIDDEDEPLSPCKYKSHPYSLEILVWRRIQKRPRSGPCSNLRRRSGQSRLIARKWAHRTFIGGNMSATKKEFINFLKRTRMFSLGHIRKFSALTQSFMHRLSFEVDKHLIKQGRKRIHLNLACKVWLGLDKLIKVDFIQKVQNLTGLANIVPVKKKNEQIPICIDFEIWIKLVPKTISQYPTLTYWWRHYWLWVFDDHGWIFGIQSIEMHLEDEEMSSFRSSRGVYFYKVTPFSLKNAGATYHCAMAIIFKEMLVNIIEC